MKLNDKQMIKYFKSKCFYCNCFPENNKTNGIDRVDNDGSYEIGNVVPCCSECNFMKKDMDLESYLNKCKMVSDRHDIILKYIKNDDKILEMQNTLYNLKKNIEEIKEKSKKNYEFSKNSNNRLPINRFYSQI